MRGSQDTPECSLAKYDTDRIIFGVQGKRRPGRPRDHRVETLVVKATLAEIAEKGLGDCTMEAIAARAGVAKATLYRRWPNKIALFHFLAGQLSDVCEPSDTGDLRKDLLSVFEPLVEQLEEGTTLAILMPIFIAEAARDDHLRKLVASLVSDRRAGGVQALQQAQQRGELRPGVDCEAVIDMINGAFAFRTLLLGEALTPKLVNTIVDQAVDGIMAD